MSDETAHNLHDIADYARSRGDHQTEKAARAMLAADTRYPYRKAEGETPERGTYVV